MSTNDLSLASFGYLQLNDVFLLTLIGRGIDNRPELVRVSGIAERTVYRRLQVLTGAGQYKAGKGFSEGHVSFVASRPHPHQQGKQLVLTGIGAELLQEIKVLQTKQ